VNVADLTRMRWLLGTLLIAAAALLAEQRRAATS
jgi:hypothetical protein